MFCWITYAVNNQLEACKWTWSWKLTTVTTTSSMRLQLSVVLHRTWILHRPVRTPSENCMPDQLQVLETCLHVTISVNQALIASHTTGSSNHKKHCKGNDTQILPAKPRIMIDQPEQLQKELHFVRTQREAANRCSRWLCKSGSLSYEHEFLWL